MSGFTPVVMKHGLKTAGFSDPDFRIRAGWSERSPLTPKLTVWMSFDDRLSKVMVSPGRTERVVGKYRPKTMFSVPSADGPSTTTV